MKNFFNICYRFALITIAVYGLCVFVTEGFWSSFHKIAYCMPAVGMFLMFSGQADLLENIKKGGTINIRARAIDFLHWFLLIFLAVGRWMVEGITIWAFILNILLLAIIGWQVGVGIGRQWYPTVREKYLGFIALVTAAIVGILAGMVRHADQSLFGWGWGIETVTAVVSTLIVIWWIVSDLKTISQKAGDYPRSFFLKGIFNNVLSLMVLAHLIIITQESAHPWVSNAGFAFNAIIGNLIFLVYYLMWEYYNSRQRKA